MPLNQNQVRVNSAVKFANAEFGKGSVLTLADAPTAEKAMLKASSNLAYKLSLIRHYVYGHFKDGILRWVSRDKICEKYLCQLPSYAMK
ncbi:MAG: hypothetical protein BWY14_01235 [Parcubacteria group bacterium ADurb.Bin192]|nr:MAG: hypothetical protein BWY14_01235 [Parcubacteria group bacterium ADurb.Bin192]